MSWFRKKEIEQTKKWQFYAVDIKNKGYRINVECKPLWETPKGVPHYFLATKSEAQNKLVELKDKWLEIYGVAPQYIYLQDYVDIPDFE